MVTNTPIGVLRAIVIFPSRLDFTVFHRLLRQTSIWQDYRRNELCVRRFSLVADTDNDDDDGPPQVIAFVGNGLSGGTGPVLVTGPRQVLLLRRDTSTL